MNPIRAWFERYFSNPEVVILTLFLVGGLGVVVFFGDMLLPVFASIVIAYLLEALVQKLERSGIPRLSAVVVVFLFFLACFLFLLFGLFPILWNQVAQVARLLPEIIAKGQEALMALPHTYPNFITEEQIQELITQIRGELTALGQYVLSLSLNSLVSVMTLAVYLVLVPMLVFFFLKDKERIIGWIRGFFPREMGLTRQVWRDVDRQIGNYVRGKMMEIIIVGVSTYVTFLVMGLQFSLLLGVLVGLSVIVPYIGAAVVTVPVLLIALFQWGWGTELAWVVVAYGIIQALDGNVLVPLLFSEVVNLHPVAIIVAVLVFGGLWGFWGVFFAIPLATVVQSVIKAWPEAHPRHNRV